MYLLCVCGTPCSKPRIWRNYGLMRYALFSSVRFEILALRQGFFSSVRFGILVDFFGGAVVILAFERYETVLQVVEKAICVTLNDQV